MQATVTRRALRRLAGIASAGMALGVFASSGAAAETHRSVSAIETDLKAAVNAIPYYFQKDWYDPVYRHDMSTSIGVPLQRVADLDTELDTADPSHAASRRPSECADLTLLALYGRPESLQKLNDAAASTDKNDAAFGQTGLMMFRWFRTPDELTQRAIVEQFRVLAGNDPDDDVLVPAALTMARYQAKSTQLTSDLRDIVAEKLTGPAADRYRAQPYKLGRPFHVDVDATNGRAVSTTDWAGKVVILDFWATWCPPCRKALPDLTDLFAADHARGLEVLGISNDSSRQDLLAFMAAHPEMSWPQSFHPAGRDGWNALSPRMGVAAIPTSFLIDRNGVLRDIEVAYLDKHLVEQLLDEPVQSPAASTPAGRAPNGSAMASEATPSPSSHPPASSDAATPPPADASAAEGRADALLSLANQYLSNNLPDRARQKLNDLLTKYPTSAAAAKAKAMLAQPDLQ